MEAVLVFIGLALLAIPVTVIAAVVKLSSLSREIGNFSSSRRLEHLAETLTDIREDLAEIRRRVSVPEPGNAEHAAAQTPEEPETPEPVTIPDAAPFPDASPTSAPEILPAPPAEENPSAETWFESAEPPKSEFRKRTEEALEKIRNWVCVGEEYRNRNVSAEYAVATTWLIRIGVLILICGIGFFVKYSIDHQLIRPELRVFGMLAAACAMVTGGLRFAGKRYHSVAVGIIGAGFATGYLAIFSACRMYDLIGWQWAYGAMIFITLCAMTLSVRRGDLFPALIGTLGGYLTPILLSRGAGDLGTYFTYLAIISGGVLFCGCFRNWKVLNLFAFAVNTVLLWIGLFKGMNAGNWKLCIFFLCLNFILFSLIPAVGTLFRRFRITLIEIFSGCAVLTVFLATALPIALHYTGSSRPGAWIILGCTGFSLFQLVLSRLLKKEDRIWNLLHLAFAAAGGAVFVPMMFSGIWITLCWSALAALLIFLGTKIPNRLLCLSGFLLYLPLTVKIFLADAGIERLFAQLAYPTALEHRLLTVGAYLASLLLSGILMRRAMRNPSFCDAGDGRDFQTKFDLTSTAQFFLTSAAVLFFAYSSFELHQFLLTFLPEFRRGGVSVWWGVWAVALLFFGIRNTRRSLRTLSLILFSVCTGKIFFFDLAGLSSLSKVAAFLALGLLMLSGAVLYTKFKDRFTK